MYNIVEIIDQYKLGSDLVVLFDSVSEIRGFPFSEAELTAVNKAFEEEESAFFLVDRLEYQIYVLFINKNRKSLPIEEYARRQASLCLDFYSKRNKRQITILDLNKPTSFLLSFVEGLLLSSYQFTKYKSKPVSPILEKIFICSKQLDKSRLDACLTVVKASFLCRDWVNEPACALGAEKIAAEIQVMSAEVGIKVEVFNRAKIEALKMGGLLAVNRGSSAPPSFTVMEWKPENRNNEKPIVLVGKGVVFDSGGMNIKTEDYMNDMKSDMAGAAMVASVMYAVAKNKLPIHVVALIPATDNKPGPDAFVSGDVVRMYNGSTVEVINTDAEGRMILADALSYADRYAPKLLIDVATLTGAAQRAIGKYGIVAMQKDAEEHMCLMKTVGDQVYERIAEFPFWDEYEELLESDIADMKNIGGPHAGMITAGKFLARFTQSPYIHLDIAGVAFSHKKEHYYTVGGTAFGLRMLYHFIEKQIQEK